MLDAGEDAFGRALLDWMDGRIFFVDSVSWCLRVRCWWETVDDGRCAYRCWASTS